jgi:hypothetical protein
MGKALQELFPLLSFDKRIGLFSINLVPPESDDENGKIIPYFTRPTNSNFADLGALKITSRFFSVATFPLP